MRRELTLPEVKKIIEDTFNEKVTKRCRSHDVIAARFTYYQLVKRFCAYRSFASIGKSIGYDHGTVLNALNKVDGFMLAYPQYEELRKKCILRCFDKTKFTLEERKKDIYDKIRQLHDDLRKLKSEEKLVIKDN